jgi:hypothetical protein
MAAGMLPLGGGTPNPRPNLRSFSTPGRYPDAILRGQLGAGAMTPRTQTAQQLAGWNQANEDWAAIEAARKKRKEAYEAMAQKSGDVPSAYKSRMGQKEARPFFADTRPISEGSVDILAPEVETLADLYRKRKNMFRMV